MHQYSVTLWLRATFAICSLLPGQESSPPSLSVWTSLWPFYLEYIAFSRKSLECSEYCRLGNEVSKGVCLIWFGLLGCFLFFVFFLLGLRYFLWLFPNSVCSDFYCVRNFWVCSLTRGESLQNLLLRVSPVVYTLKFYAAKTILSEIYPCDCMSARPHCLLCSQPIDISESELKTFHENSYDFHFTTFIGTKRIFVTERVTVIFKELPHMCANL